MLGRLAGPSCLLIFDVDFVSGSFHLMGVETEQAIQNLSEPVSNPFPEIFVFQVFFLD